MGFLVEDVRVRTVYQDNDESHYVFKQELAYKLAMPFVRRRVSVSQKQPMQAIGIEIPPPVPTTAAIHSPIQHRWRHVSPRGGNKKSRSKCHRCRHCIRSKHSMKQSVNCARKRFFHLLNLFSKL